MGRWCILVSVYLSLSLIVSNTGFKVFITAFTKLFVSLPDELPDP